MRLWMEMTGEVRIGDLDIEDMAPCEAFEQMKKLEMTVL
jgi:hypothetical protein